MKMVKSLLLGSAGVLAVTAAQAADLPVKAKPVEYVKVCSLYGAGFYYIPGTDTCLKLGGYVRTEWNHNAAGSFVPFASAASSAAGASARYTLTDTNDLISRTRLLWSLDARSQTEYGTLRAYGKVGIQWSTGDGVGAGSGAVAYYERAFIQFAGFTFGGAQSFFDFFAYPAYSYQSSLIGSDTGGTSTTLLAYTAQLGNGVTATVSLEENVRRRKNLHDVTQTGTFATQLAAANGVGALTTNDNTNGVSFPDVIGALRVDQTWGSAQVAVAAHQLTPGYYGANTDNNGHPDREWGWAALAGIELNLPTGPGDKFAIAATWADGALGYTSTNGVQSMGMFGTGGSNGQSIASVALGPIVDGIYATGGQIETIEAWSIYAALNHKWTPNLQTSLYGGYMEIDWGTTATNLYCSGSASTSVAGCNPDFSYWQAGSRTEWSPVANFTVGLDIMYTKLNSAHANTTDLVTLGANGARQGGTYKVEDLDFWHGIIRFQRNFWP
jgi:hypothetical protein